MEPPAKRHKPAATTAAAPAAAAASAPSGARAADLQVHDGQLAPAPAKRHKPDPTPAAAAAAAAPSPGGAIMGAAAPGATGAAPPRDLKTTYF